MFNTLRNNILLSYAIFATVFSSIYAGETIKNGVAHCFGMYWLHGFTLYDVSLFKPDFPVKGRFLFIGWRLHIVASPSV